MSWHVVVCSGVQRQIMASDGATVACSHCRGMVTTMRYIAHHAIQAFFFYKDVLRASSGQYSPLLATALGEALTGKINNLRWRML